METAGQVSPSSGANKQAARTSNVRLWLPSQISATSSVVSPAGSLGSPSALARNLPGSVHVPTLGAPNPLGDVSVFSCKRAGSPS